MCEIWGSCGVREERLLKREKGGVESRLVWEAETWHPGRPPDYIKGQIGGFALHKLYRWCRPYDFC